MSVAATLAMAPVPAGCPAAAQTAADPISVLFVGNSFTFARYDPALNYNAGPGSSTDSSTVHDLLCPSLNASGGCTSGAEAVASMIPTSANTPGSTLLQQLNYLQAHPQAQYTEPGPFGGVAGIFLQFTKEAGLHYDVSLITVSGATLSGFLSNKGSEAGTLPLIANAKYDQVVLQDQSFRPLPTTVTVNGQTVPTRGNPAGFQAGVTGLINTIDQADAAAGKANAGITLYETQPVAANGYTSNNPNAPIFGSATPSQNGNNPAYAPYVGSSDPIAQMASDLHNAYTGVASNYNASNPAGSHVNVALAGDGWVSAINLGLAVQNPYLTNNPANKFNLWDSNPLTACCTTPIGYHPSSYGAYLNALSIFYTMTGVDPVTLAAEFNPNSPLFKSSAAYALGLSANDAQLLAIAAADTVRAGGPVSNFELQVGTIWASLTGSAGLIKDGPGTVTLTSANTYSGPTKITGGTLEVDGSIVSSTTVGATAILTGTGAVGSTEVQSGGILAPGKPGETAGGKLTVNGPLTFDAGSFFVASGFAAPTATTPLGRLSTDSIQLNGNLTIAANNAQIILNGIYLPGVRYDLIDLANGNTITGMFGSASFTAQNLMQLISPNVEYFYDPAVIIVPQANFASAAQTKNQLNFANALDAAANAGNFGNNGVTLLARLIANNTVATAPAAFNSLTGEGITGQQNAALNAGNLFVTTVLGQATFSADDRSNDIFGLKDGPVCSLKDGYDCAIAGRARFWAAGFGGYAQLDSQSSTGSASQQSHNSGVAAGVDYEVTRTFLVGISGGNSDSTFSVSDRGTSGTVEGGHFGIYGRENFGALYVAGAVEYAHYNNTTDRRVTALGGIEEEKGRFSSDEWLARFEGGYKYLVDSVNVTPFAGFEVESLSNSAFTEFSTGVAGLSVAGKTVDIEKAFLGVQFDTKFAMPEGWSVSPYARISWENEFNTKRSITASLVALPSNFTVYAPAAAAGLVHVNTGFKVDITKDISLLASFDGQFSDRGNIYGGTGGLKIRF